LVLTTVKEYMQLNDFLILTWIDEWAYYSQDNILKQLSNDFINRKLFGVFIPKEGRKEYADQREKVKELLGKDFDYFFVEDEPKDIAYKDYFYYMNIVKDPQEVWYLDSDGRAHQLSGYGGLLIKGKDALNYSESRWYLPKEIIHKMKG